MTELTPLQKQTLDLFAKSELKNIFYWTGGTLLSVMYLHHRRSQDIDFFSDTCFSYEQPLSFVNELKEKFNLEFVEEKKIYDRWEFFLHNNEQMRLEFVRYDHPCINPREEWRGIKIDSLDDIAANKLMAMLDRNEPKDVFDMYFLLTSGGYSLATLLKLVEGKFGVQIEESSAWSEAFKGMKELERLKPFMLVDEEEQQRELLAEINDYFSTQAKKFLDRNLE